ncbi:hypothetical protein D9758_001021 [Tetrapyrgos nigripes]|uniref:Protein-serine/threonine kinase n=1 Tax=Tetrapyrgos nigripes TaxID=182062 RepID=A0A8H5LUM8_9AGAR|nr:hypothetical protein D9758_001021 [Tetrapyrgos nigripes]
MGITGLARWVNSPPDGLSTISENIVKNHNGVYKEKWQLSVKSYRSVLSTAPQSGIQIERSMCALTMKENVFVSVEDPVAPTRADLLLGDNAYQPGHYRTTFLTLSPPGALEQLLEHLKAKWVPVRQAAPGNAPRNRGQGTGQQLMIDGLIFAIGTDWLVRAGNVILSGGAMKGMLLEAEYLPLPTLQSPADDGTSELLSNLLTSVLPNIRDAKTVAITISDAQWEDVLWDREEEEKEKEQPKEPDPDDIYVYGDEEDVPQHRRGDWVGVDRDRRSAYLIIARTDQYNRGMQTWQSVISWFRWNSYPYVFPLSLGFPASADHVHAIILVKITLPQQAAGPLCLQRDQASDFASTCGQFGINLESHGLTVLQVFFGRSMSEERLMQSANYVRTELPVRIAHRLRDLQALPYIVVTQEGVAKVYELYWSAFEKFRRYPSITNLQDNERFCEFLREILDEHGSVIPNLSLGLSLSSPYLPPDTLDLFMHRMLVSRISRRVLTQHHLALSDTYMGKKSLRYTDSEPRVGIIYTGLDVRRSIEKCAKLLKRGPLASESDEIENGTMPEVVIEGNLDTKFSYIREHLEYIVFELLKNSMRATRLKHRPSSSVPPITATIALGTNDIGIRISDQGGGLLTVQNHKQIKSPSDLFSFSHVRNPQRMEDSRLGTLRSASSRKEGVWATVHEQVESWQQTSRKDDPGQKAGVGSHAQLGIGLPMSNIFATYFGGSLDIVSLDGWGTDAYVRLPKLGTNLEAVNF